MKVRKAIMLSFVFCLCAVSFVAWLLCNVPMGKFQDARLKQMNTFLLFQNGNMKHSPGGTIGWYSKTNGKWILTSENGNTWEMRPSIFKLQLIKIKGYQASNEVLQRVVFQPSQP